MKKRLERILEIMQSHPLYFTHEEMEMQGFGGTPLPNMHRIPRPGGPRLLPGLAEVCSVFLLFTTFPKHHLNHLPGQETQAPEGSHSNMRNLWPLTN